MHLVFCIKSSKTHGEFRVRKMANQSARQSEKLRKGSWHEEEDKQLTTFVTWMGEKKWDLIAKASGLERSGKSCRFRWLNYLRPNLKRGCISSEEEGIILQLHRKWGNKWSRIARWLPGRTDNEIKNYWRSHLRKKIPIQPEEYFQCKPKVGKQEPPFKKCAIIGPRYGHEDKDVPKSNSHNLTGFSNFEVTESPYEIRLSNWIAQLTNDDNREVNCHIECESLGFCYCYPNMNFTENNQRDYLWDSLFSSLWDMAA